MADAIGRPVLKSYWQLDQGIWSPRDQRYGWREYDTYETRAKAAKAADAILKDDPKYPLLLVEVKMLMVWNEDVRPEWDTTKAKAEEEASNG